MSRNFVWGLNVLCRRNKLKNKVFISYDYTSRYAGVPNYFDALVERDVAGIPRVQLRYGSKNDDQDRITVPLQRLREVYRADVLFRSGRRGIRPGSDHAGNQRFGNRQY